MYRNSPLDRVDTEPLIIFLGAGASFSSGIPVASKLKEIICDILPDNSEEKEYIQKNYINNENRGIQDLADYLEINASPAETFAFKEAIAQKLYMQSTIISAEYRMLAFLIKHKYISAIYCRDKRYQERCFPYDFCRKEVFPPSENRHRSQQKQLRTGCCSIPIQR